MGDEIGKTKFAFVPEPEQLDLQAALAKQHMDKIREMVTLEANLKPTGLDAVVAEIVANNEEYKDRESDLKHAFYNLRKAEGRRQILEDKIRPDGRKLDEIRPITCEVDLIPRVHGSAMFKRGATQALTITTLGSPAMAQLIEDAEGEETRHYIHHYNMPPYASGEAGRFGAPTRRISIHHSSGE
jgi:polyribonucleotide nucleotidyltransferase